MRFLPLLLLLTTDLLTAGEPPLLIKNCSVFDAQSGEFLPDHSVLTQGDKISGIEVLDSTDELFAAQKANLDKWNKVLG